MGGFQGSHTYRITPNKVKRLPAISDDPDPVRRFCRLNGLPLTLIKEVEWGEQVYFEHPLYQGDGGFRSIEEGEAPVKLVLVHTTGNPEVQEKLLVVKGHKPRTWEDFSKAAQTWARVMSGYYRLS